MKLSPYENRSRIQRRYIHEPVPDPDFFRPPHMRMGKYQQRVYLGRYAKLNTALFK
ncbi:MAG: hypothetical protein F6J87_30500 [Spirulina sp. SIO3F2]|nr:hypothetical protein [Spirulina sp. SIO3F2]